MDDGDNRPGPETGLFLDEAVEQAAPHRRRRRWPVPLAAAVVVAAATVGLTMAVGSQPTPAAALSIAVSRTLGDKTASLSENIAVTVGGVTSSGTGSGSVDFSRNAIEQAITVHVDGTDVTERVIGLAGTVDLQIPGVALVEPGKSWVSMDLTGLSPSAGSSLGTMGSGDPLAMLRVLEKGGATVSSLGSSTVDGATVDGYQAVVDAAQVQATLAKANLPAWMRQALAQVTAGPETVKLYVDSAGQVRREALSDQQTIAGKAMAITVTVDFSGFGSPVSISAPPADEVVGMQQFLQDAAAAAADQGGAAASSPGT